MRINLPTNKLIRHLHRIFPIQISAVMKHRTFNAIRLASFSANACGLAVAATDAYDMALAWLAKDQVLSAL